MKPYSTGMWDLFNPSRPLKETLLVLAVVSLAVFIFNTSYAIHECGWDTSCAILQMTAIGTLLTVASMSGSVVLLVFVYRNFPKTCVRMAGGEYIRIWWLFHVMFGANALIKFTLYGETLWGETFFFMFLFTGALYAMGITYLSRHSTPF